MEVGSSRLPTAIPSRGTQLRGAGPHGFAYGAVTLYGGAFQPTSATVGRPAGARSPSRGAATPHPPTVIPWGIGLGSPPFGRPYSGDPCWFLFLPLLRCFRSGGSRPLPGAPRALRPWREVPFGDPGFNGCLRLPRAYRSLPRPSSAPEPSHPPDGVGAAGPWAGPSKAWSPPRGRGTAIGAPGAPGCLGAALIVGVSAPSALRPEASGSWAASIRGAPGQRSHEHRPSPASREVIQPQVPLRLPCYDFSPLAGVGFDPTPCGAGPHPTPTRVERRAVCARSRDVFTAR